MRTLPGERSNTLTGKAYIFQTLGHPYSRTRAAEDLLLCNVTIADFYCAGRGPHLTETSTYYTANSLRQSEVKVSSISVIRSHQFDHQQRSHLQASALCRRKELALPSIITSQLHSQSRSRKTSIPSHTAHIYLARLPRERRRVQPSVQHQETFCHALPRCGVCMRRCWADS